MKEWKSLLNQFLETYTNARDREVVDAHDKHQALDAMGVLVDCGHSFQEEHIHDIHAQGRHDIHTQGRSLGSKPRNGNCRLGETSASSTRPPEKFLGARSPDGPR